MLLFFIAIFSKNSEVAEKKEEVVLKEKVVVELNKEQIAKAKELDKYFKRRHEKIGFNGAVLFAEKGQVIYENAFGFA